MARLLAVSTTARLHATLFSLPVAVVGLVALALGPPALAVTGSCTPSATQLCVQGGLIAVEATWGDSPQDAQAVSLGFTSGWLWFDAPDAPEIYVEVLDACALNSRYWVKVISLTDRAWSLTVRFPDTGGEVVYMQPVGIVDAFIDFKALACAPPLAPTTSKGAAGDSSGVVSLLDGRFSARVTRTTGSGTGVALPIALAPRGAAFAFFSPSTIDAAVKIEDGDGGFFRVVYGWTSSTAFELEVIDRCTGNRAVYSIPDGAGTGGAVDESSFPLTPSCVLFSDGFESGDLSGWD